MEFVLNLVEDVGGDQGLIGFVDKIDFDIPSAHGESCLDGLLVRAVLGKLWSVPVASTRRAVWGSWSGEA